MAENVNVIDFKLTPDEISSIATLDTGASLFFGPRSVLPNTEPDVAAPRSVCYSRILRELKRGGVHV